MLPDFMQRLHESETPVVVEIWAPWCAPCRQMAPALERVEESYAGRVALWRINADEASALVQQLGVYGIPTLLLYRNGVEITRRTGGQSETGLSTFFEAALTDKPTATVTVPQTDRWLRLSAGFALLLLGRLNGPSLVLMLAGMALLFSAVYDRCPLWQAISTRVRALFA
jgi:thioredoxin